MISFRRFPVLCALAATVALWNPSGAFATIPLPPLVIYGQVSDGMDILTSGELEWTYTPMAGGSPVVVTVELEEIVVGPDTFSYSARIPLELLVSGLDPTGVKLSLSSTPAQFDRAAALGGQPATISASVLGDSFMLNADDHPGTVERVDIMVSAAGACCPGDADLNEFVNTDDYRSVRDNFGAPNPAMGDASCDDFVNISDYVEVRDHFGQGCSTRGEQGASSVGQAARPRDDVAPSNLAMTFAAEAAQGGFFEVEIRLDAASASNAMLLGGFVEYDPMRLRFESGAINSLSFNNELFSASPREAESGVVAFSAASSAGLSPGQHSVALLRFEALAPGETELRFLQQGARDTGLVDEEFVAIPLNVESLMLSVSESNAPGGSGFKVY